MVMVLSIGAAVLFVFFLADLIYTLDHYLVHFDRERYKLTHAKHHSRYNGTKSGIHLNHYELSTYTTAAIVSLLVASVFTLMSGNVGFILGAVLKFIHTLLFHLYQHGWWGPVPVRQQHKKRPSPNWWGLVSAERHAFHHTHPNDAVFSFAESWSGFDRILEWAHPYIYRFTVDGRADSSQQKIKRAVT